MKARAGMTLIELLIAMVIFGLVISGAIGFLATQGKGLRVLSDRSAAVQNGRFSRDLLRQELRTVGTNVTEEQPTIVLANDSAFAFNSDLTTNSKDSVALTGAVYVDQFAPSSQITAVTLERQFTVPASNPTFRYPLRSYSVSPSAFINSDAETVSYRFVPDTAGLAGTYALWRQVNDQSPELVATGLRRSPSIPFLRYYYDPSEFGALNPNLDTIPRSWLPLTKSVPRRGLDTDTGTAISTRIDALRAVEVTYEVTPARGGVREVVRYLVPMPNVAHARQSRACGRVPITPSVPTATWRTDSLLVRITWSRAVDDGAGERDAIRYVLWRQLVGATSWGEPISTIAATQAATYSVQDNGMPMRPGTYRYALSVQDCTPNVSSLAVSGTTVVP
ncbi:PilW family protein [Gemmatimonas sp.]|uniref:PilW family protein n=1 Tax=Gemmatimonas sp. TaxID=1962908 RepID=UPI00356228E0